MNKKRINMLTSILVCFMMLFSTTVFATDISKDKFKNLNEIDEIYQEIKRQIINDYGDIYTLNNFTYDYIERLEGNIQYIDININTDMILIRHPSDSPFIQGLSEALQNESDLISKDAIQKEIDFYTKNVEMYYNIPYASTFTYTIAFNKTQNDSLNAELRMILNNYELFYRNDTQEEIILINVDDLAEVENESLERQRGYNSAEMAANYSRISTNVVQPFAASTVTYDRIAAQTWANDNATKSSEFPSSSVTGTDCANFVSKAINAGGIPEDNAGKWYRASTWGGWPGDNWLRTGYNNNGGVVPYMLDKGYFYQEPSYSKVFAGSIMYWTKTSHVALVTYGDTVKIMYAQHGASNSKDNVYRDANGVYVSNVNFYLPSSSIMKK